MHVGCTSCPAPLWSLPSDSSTWDEPGEVRHRLPRPMPTRRHGYGANHQNPAAGRSSLLGRSISAARSTVKPQRNFAHRHRHCGTALRFGLDRWVAVAGVPPSRRSQKYAGQDPAASGFGH